MKRRSFLKSAMAAIGSVAVLQAQPLLVWVEPREVVVARLAKDIAAAWCIEQRSATRMLTDALRGETGALARFGYIDQYRPVLETLTDHYAGAAGDHTLSLAGQFGRK